MPVNLISDLILLLFPIVLFKMGFEMAMMKSFEKELDKFEKNPENGSIVKRWIFGWRWKRQRMFTKASIEGFGNTFLTLFYRGVGIFFILLGITSWIYLLIKYL